MNPNPYQQPPYGNPGYVPSGYPQPPSSYAAQSLGAPTKFPPANYPPPPPAVGYPPAAYPPQPRPATGIPPTQYCPPGYSGGYPPSQPVVIPRGVNPSPVPGMPLSQTGYCKKCHRPATLPPGVKKGKCACGGKIKVKSHKHKKNPVAKKLSKLFTSSPDSCRRIPVP